MFKAQIFFGKYNREKVLFLFCFFISNHLFSQTQINPWQLKKYENGISIYTRTTENSKYKELKSVFLCQNPKYLPRFRLK